MPAGIVLGITGMDLCPVAAVLSYTMVPGTHQGLFFITSTKLPLNMSKFVAAIQVPVGLYLPDQQYASHSFRIGAVTTSAGPACRGSLE